MTVEPGVTLKLTPEQYRNLILTSYLGTAMINTAWDELASEAEAGDPVEFPAGLQSAADGSRDLMQTILSGARTLKSVDLDPDDPAADVVMGDDGELIPGEDLENLAVDCADVYGETIFWTQLAQGLAERDLGQLHAQNRPMPDDMDESELLQNLIEMYLEEFSENGLEHIMIPLLDENEMSHPN